MSKQFLLQSEQEHLENFHNPARIACTVRGRTRPWYILRWVLLSGPYTNTARRQSKTEGYDLL
jgi:hypothetical protein